MQHPVDIVMLMNEDHFDRGPQHDPDPMRPRRRWGLAAAGVAGIAAIGYAAIGFFGVHTLFFDSTVSEAPPEFAVPADSGISTFSNTSGQFVGRSHATAGTASVLNDGNGSQVLRLENFATDNGPDLKVFLVSASADAPDSTIASDAINLGPLKGNIGDQNYDIPPGTDTSVYRTVVIWCERFGVSFGAASLT